MINSAHIIDRRVGEVNERVKAGELDKKIDFLKKLFNIYSMRLEIKLFANFREYLPPGSDSYSCWVDLEEGSTIGQVLERLKIPDSLPMITLVNGLHRTFEDILRPGDILSIFPPVAGG